MLRPHLGTLIQKIPRTPFSTPRKRSLDVLRSFVACWMLPSAAWNPNPGFVEVPSNKMQGGSPVYKVHMEVMEAAACYNVREAPHRWHLLSSCCGRAQSLIFETRKRAVYICLCSNEVPLRRCRQVFNLSSASVGLLKLEVTYG